MARGREADVRNSTTMEDKVLLKVYGLSYSKLQSGAFALILEQVNGPYRIPVVIGAAEAQSIAIVLEGITPPRPMTHDLFESFTHAFGIRLLSVFIYKFEDGIFSSELTFTDSQRTISIDARTSDAIAIALRTKSPIYTTYEILSETGFVMEPDEEGETRDEDIEPDEIDVAVPQPKLENFTLEELENTLAELIDNEEYEEAARVQRIIDRKRGNLPASPSQGDSNPGGPEGGSNRDTGGDSNDDDNDTNDGSDDIIID